MKAIIEVGKNELNCPRQWKSPSAARTRSFHDRYRYHYAREISIGFEIQFLDSTDMIISAIYFTPLPAEELRKFKSHHKNPSFNKSIVSEFCASSAVSTSAAGPTESLSVKLVLSLLTFSEIFQEDLIERWKFTHRHRKMHMESTFRKITNEVNEPTAQFLNTSSRR